MIKEAEGLVVKPDKISAEFRGAFSGFAPLLGEHTREVLREAGLSEAEIAELERTEIVRSSATPNV